MRIKKLVTMLKRKGNFPYLITDMNNIKYLTGFGGSYAFMIIDRNKIFFISDSRYVEYAQSILNKSIRFVLQNIDLFRTVRSIINGTGEKCLYIEDSALQLSTFLKMKKDLKGIKLIPCDDAVKSLRIIKDDDEIRIFREAASLTDHCYEYLLKIISPGMGEWEISLEIEAFYKKKGCRRVSFDPIVASGSDSSMPHYETSMTKKISRGDIVLIDMGCQYRGYNSDLTRTVFIGTIDPEIRKIYEIVLRAQKYAISKVKPGITSGRLDSMARDVIRDEGFGGMFGHSLGHGLGIEIHEEPSIKLKGEITLKKGMVITIEPGIYIPGRGGVRIEDMVLVTGKGQEVLTKSEKEITII